MGTFPNLCYYSTTRITKFALSVLTHIQSQRIHPTMFPIISSILTKSLYNAEGFYTQCFPIEFWIQAFEFELGAYGSGCVIARTT